MLGSIGYRGLSGAQVRALNRLKQLGEAIDQSAERLTTLKRINSAKDDPAGLVRASQLESELAGAEAALDGITQSNAQLSTADDAAADILSQLQTARSLAIASADSGISAEDLAANQLQIDSIIDAIAQASRVEFGGRRLLDGSSSFRVSNLDNSEFNGVTITNKQSADNISVDVNVTQQALQATDTYDNLVPLLADATITITGTRGSSAITLGLGSTTQAIVDAVNAETYLTGVTAEVDGTDVDFTSTEYGSAATIDIEVLDGTFTTAGNNSVQGTDAEATVKGISVTGDGNTLHFITSGYGLDIELDPSASGALTTFNISGEGLQYVIGTSASDTARFGLPKLTTATLGNASGKLISLASGGSNSLTGGNAATAAQVIDDAISQVTQARNRIGSFQNYTLDSAEAVLTGIQENSADALSAIQDVDVGLETAQLANYQLLQQSTTEALTISTLHESNVLDLLQVIALKF